MKNLEDLEISDQLTDYGFWGNIKDSKNSEFYTPNTNPYENIPPDQYGFWGLFKDDQSNINDIDLLSSDSYKSEETSKNHELRDKCINNLLNIVKSNDSSRTSKMFDYKCKFTIDKVKYKK